MEVFEQVQNALQAGNADSGFDLLIERFRKEKTYPLIFEARLMKKRNELGLPLIQTEPFHDLDAGVLASYEETTIAAAREVGGLFLTDGDVQKAWPYFRAVGEKETVREAIDNFAGNEEGEILDGVVEVAYHEQVHPKKGFELILKHYGICRAITNFSQYPADEGRADCAYLLAETLSCELAVNLKYAIQQKEGAEPETDDPAELVRGREWLFEGNAYYIDTSHVSSLVQMAHSIERRETLELLLGLTAYGEHLGEMYQFPGNAPFENVFGDFGIYIRTVLGRDVDAGLAHFRRKIETCDAQTAGTAPAQALVNLLLRIDRPTEAIDVAVEHLKDADPQFLACPNVLQLCQIAGDYSRLAELARERNDLLSFAAATLQSALARPSDAAGCCSAD